MIPYGNSERPYRKPRVPATHQSQGCGPSGPPLPPPAPEYAIQYVGFSPGRTFGDYFSDDTLRAISYKVTQYLKGVHPEGKRIVVPNDSIRHVRDRVFDNMRGNETDMVDNVVAVIVNQIRDELEMAEQNSKLTRWVTKYDEDPRWGLRRHDPIYARRERDINKGGFIMNY